MKKIIIVSAIVLLGFVGVAYASDLLVPFWSGNTDVSYGEVKVYKFTDKPTETSCYVSVTKVYSGQASSISCVK